MKLISVNMSRNGLASDKAMKITFGLLSLIVFSIAQAQERFTISGQVTNAKNGETIIGATLRVRGSSIGSTSNEYGFYSMTLTKGDYIIECSAVSVSQQEVKVSLQSSITLNWTLQESIKELDGVTVKAVTRGRSISNPQMGMERLSISETKTIPLLFGERDVLKAIQLMPGIKNAGEGNSGFFVRGGAADQNLILLDEAPVYNSSHLLGFFSTFNADAIKDIVVYKGGMPAQYGGRLSSVLDIKMNEGNNQHYGVSGGIGLISSKLTVEGPIQKSQSSFLVSGRRTYADMFLKLSNDSTLKKNALYFYDLNTKMNFVLGKKDRLYISGYFGRDKLGFDRVFGLGWGNATGTFRWNHIFHSRLFSNTSFIVSNYNYKISLRSGTNDIDVLSQISDINLKNELQWYATGNHSIRIGINLIHHTINPGEIKTSLTSNYNSSQLQKRFSLENALYLTDTWKATPRISITYGARITAFTILGKGDFYTLGMNGSIVDTIHYGKNKVVKTYLNIEPRLAFSYVLNSQTSIKASFVRNAQNLHLISNSTISSPTDKWIASTNNIKPEISDLFSIGWYRNVGQNRYEITVESYYKTMLNQIDYRNGADVFNSDAIESQLLFGKGRAYGLEMSLRKKSGKLTGWLSYTLSKTERKIPGINEDQWFNARQDRTHDLSLVGSYTLNKKWTLSANWVYYTGDAVSFPSGKYQVDNQVVYYYKRRNGYRLPDYHRLDLGATVRLKIKRRFASDLTFGLYNAYGRENAFSIYFRDNKDQPDKTEAVQLALFKVIPSVSYNFKF